MTRRDYDPATAPPDDRPAAKAKAFDTTGPRAWRGSLAGEAIGSANTILAYATDTIGEGPRLHVHPYDESFVVIMGQARFFVGDEVIEAAAGDVLLAPAGQPHRFENAGPGRLQTIDIHHSPRWIQTDLD